MEEAPSCFMTEEQRLEMGAAAVRAVKAAEYTCLLYTSGAPARGERTAKYNRLMEIEHELGTQAVYLGGQTVKGFQ